METKQFIMIIISYTYRYVGIHTYKTEKSYLNIVFSELLKYLHVIDLHYVTDFSGSVSSEH